MPDFPKHIILHNKVYSLSINEAKGGRAFDRILKDYIVEGENPHQPADIWTTRLGSSREIFDDYPSYGYRIPFEWLLVRFLAHHVRTNSVHIISGPGGEVLTSATFRNYLGNESSDDQVDNVLRMICGSWIMAFPNTYISLSDLYVSTDITLEAIKRGINFLKHLGHLKEVNPDTYSIEPSIFDRVLSRKESLSLSLDRRSNRYFQEIVIEASEPFCFVIMPFREEELSQSIYKDVIKPLVEDHFKISCYRVDEDHLPDRIDNKIYSYLLNAAFVIAEVTTANPNVFYELGLAHMLEKNCIIITQKSATEVPFDLNRIRAETYKNSDELQEILKNAIAALAFKPT